MKDIAGLSVWNNSLIHFNPVELHVVLLWFPTNVSSGMLQPTLYK